MAARAEIGFNRIMKPELPITDFVRLAAECGARHIEIRNDLADPSLLGSESSESITAVCRQTGVSVLTINALQRFNDPALFDEKQQELAEMIETAASVGCRMIVLCPVNDPADIRSPDDQHRDLVAALHSYANLFRDNGIVGLVEPLGFPVCSVRTKKLAVAGIRDSGHGDIYRIVHDTFHHYLSGEQEFFPRETGLVHASGVVAGKDRAAITDDDRILVDSTDIMNNRSQVRDLYHGGCHAVLSFEPFSPQVQWMRVEDLRRSLMDSIAFLAI